MIKIIRPDTPIEVVSISDTSESGLPGEERFESVFDFTIFCEWKNRFGKEVFTAASEGILQPVTIKLYYVPGINETHYIKNLDTDEVFEIIGIDNVSNRNHILEISAKRYAKG